MTPRGATHGTNRQGAQATTVEYPDRPPPPTTSPPAPRPRTDHPETVPGVVKAIDDKVKQRVAKEEAEASSSEETRNKPHSKPNKRSA